MTTPQPPQKPQVADDSDDDSTATPPPEAGNNVDANEPVYADWIEFAEDWLFPAIGIRISNNNREGNYAWCPQWWRHHPVALRIAALHAAFEAAATSDDTSAINSYLLHHVDPTIRTLLDAVNGPMRRCTTDTHSDTPALTYEPVPPGWFA